MSEAERRYTRYAVPAGAITQQEIKVKGVFGLFAGWLKCQIRDISQAGAMVRTDRRLGIGDRIELRFMDRQRRQMSLHGAVVNLSCDHRQGGYKLGVSLDAPEEGSIEAGFLLTLDTSFDPA